MSLAESLFPYVSWKFDWDDWCFLFPDTWYITFLVELVGPDISSFTAFQTLHGLIFDDRDWPFFWCKVHQTSSCFFYCVFVWSEAETRNIHMVNASTAKLSSMHFHGWEQGKDSSGGEVHITCLNVFRARFCCRNSIWCYFCWNSWFSPMKWGIL